MTAATPQPPDDKPSIPDDVWEQFVRDSESDIRASAPKEPSARARMVTERLRQQDAEAAAAQGKRGRKGKKAKAQAAVPDGWRTGPAWEEMNGKAARRRRWRGLLGVVVAVGIVVVVLNPSAALSWIPGSVGGSTDGAADASTLPPETGRPTAAPTDEEGVPTLAHPFAGSPAEKWRSGEEAIVVPTAKALGTFSKSEVAGALGRAKTLLVASNLDPDVLRGARPTVALALLDPKMGKTFTSLRDSFAHPTEENDPTSLFTRFDKSEVDLVGDTVKLRGRMTYKKLKDGSVRVTVDYTFVYPAVRAGDDSEVTRTIVRRYLELEMSDPKDFNVTPGKFWLAKNWANFGNSECFTDDGFLHPHFSSGTTSSEAPEPSGSAVDPYDRSEAMAKPDSGACNVSTRT